MSITEVEDLTMFCRVCLQLPLESELLDLNLIYDEDEQLTYYDCFTVCTQIQISDGEGLPQNLCRSCGLELQMAYDFYKKVDESKRFLIQLQDQQAKALLPATEEEVNDATPLVFEQEEVVEQEQEQEQEMEEEVEVEEHLDMEEYQAVEHLDDEDRADADILHFNGKINFINATSGANKKSPIYQREANASNTEYTHSMENNTFTRIKVDQILSETEDMYEIKEEHGVATENNFVNIIDENKTEQIQHEHLQVHSTAEAEESTANSIDVFSDGEKIAHTTESNADATQKPVITFEVRPQYACDVCSKRFIKFRNYNNHLKSHTLVGMHKCDKCDMIYLRAASLERHMEQFHTSPDEVGDHQRCRFCQKFYRSNYALNIHMRFHTGDLPCECSTCGKRFSDNGHLRQHIRVKHQQFRFKCVRENCGKVFETDRALRNHGYGHDKNWPFVCAHCGKGMGTKYNCRTHIANKHKICTTDDDLNAMQQFKRKKVSQSHCFQKVPDAKLKFGDKNNILE